MRIFTKKAFQEELAKVREERDKEEWLRNRFRDIEDNVARLERDINELRMEFSQIRDGVRCARGTSSYGTPVQIGSEPIPKIEAEERKDNG